MQQYHPKNRGFLLIEAIVGITILSIIVAATLSLLNSKAASTNFVSEQFTAISLASKLAFEYKIFDINGVASGIDYGFEHTRGTTDSINGNLVLSTEVLAPTGTIKIETYGY
jgi:type II secretory pathway pseudopilin PulG